MKFHYVYLFSFSFLFASLNLRLMFLAGRNFSLLIFSLFYFSVVCLFLLYSFGQDAWHCEICNSKSGRGFGK